MKPVEELLSLLHDCGAVVCLAGDTVRVAGPTVLPRELIDRLRERKSEIRSLLERGEVKISSMELPRRMVRERASPMDRISADDAPRRGVGREDVGDCALGPDVVHVRHRILREEPASRQERDSVAQRVAD